MDQGVGHFKGCLSRNRKIPPVHLNVCSLKKSHNAPQKPGSIDAHYVPLMEMNSQPILSPNVINLLSLL